MSLTRFFQKMQNFCFLSVPYIEPEQNLMAYKKAGFSEFVL